jgi:uncharacterized protein YndB with AHSA1/START domain
MSDRIEKRIELKAPPARVWRALTDHKEFGSWFGVTLEAPFVVGQVSRGPKTNPCYAHLEWEATITAMRPQSYFAFTWRPYAIDPDKDYSQEPPTLVEFKLTPTAAGTLLVVVESGFDKIPSERRIEALRMNDNGWDIQIKNIEHHVAQ